MELRLDLEPSATLNLRTISMGRVIWDQGETDPKATNQLRLSESVHRGRRKLAPVDHYSFAN